MAKNKMKKEYFTISPLQTKKRGQILAEDILKIVPQKGAIVIGLEGDLGGGKTTFLKGLAKGFGIKKKILSPTFVIMKRFKIENRKSRIKNFYHIDCYRVQKAKEILDLGFKKITSNPKNIVAVEWAERIRKIMPRETIWMNFEFVKKRKRKIVIKWNN